MGFAHSDQPEKKVALLVASDLLQLAKETKKFSQLLAQFIVQRVMNIGGQMVSPRLHHL